MSPIGEVLLLLIVLLLAFIVALAIHGYYSIKARISKVEGYVCKVREFIEDLSSDLEKGEAKGLGVRALYKHWQKSDHLCQKYGAYSTGSVKELDEKAPWMPNGKFVDPPDPSDFRSVPEQLHFIACGTRTQAVLLNKILQKKKGAET